MSLRNKRGGKKAPSSKSPTGSGQTLQTPSGQKSQNSLFLGNSPLPIHLTNNEDETISVPDFPCIKCTLSTQDQDSIECSGCKKWCHRLCSGLSEGTYNAIVAMDDDALLWQCQSCRHVGAPSQGGAVSQTTDEKIDRLTDSVNMMLNQLLKTQAGIATALEERPTRTEMKSMIEEEVSERVEAKINDSLNIEERVESTVKEFFDRERRRTSVLISNLPEGGNDKTEATATLGKIVDMDERDIVSTTRLGAKGPKPRKLRIKLDTVDRKRQILRSSRNLIDHNLPADERLYVDPDRTPTEQKKDKSLRDELKRQREVTGNNNLIIRKGAIVERDQAPGPEPNK